MKTLFITVGTRQLGWRCQDDTICCFGADGDRNQHPRHIDRLFQELGVERGHHQGESWGVHELSRRYYQHCLDELEGDFSAIELLLDHQVIESQYSQGLTHIVLWGTHQPESTAWTYRNKDTRWLAHLMAGKIRQTWLDLTVEVFEPVVDASHHEAMRHELEGFIVRHTQPVITQEGEGDFTVLIQSKGAVPEIAQSLEMCAAGLVRQYPVFNIIPVEPEPLYAPGSQSANRSYQSREVSIGQYFWPIERLRIVSAWERGDFHEAAIWLRAHQDRYRSLYRLAQCLTLATNWQVDAVFQRNKRGLGQWLSTGSLSKGVEASPIEAWQLAFNYICKRKSAQTWETSFLLYLLLRQGNDTDAFMRFAQTLERLLYLRSQEGHWFREEDLKGRHPGFKQLIDKWFEIEDKPVNGPLYKQFDRIRNTRNQVVHQAAPMTAKDICKMWQHQNSMGDLSKALARDMAFRLMMETLEMVCDLTWQTPKTGLIQSLYEWGLGQLKNS